MIAEICAAVPLSLVTGVSALIGALIYAGYSIYEKKKKYGKEFKFEPTMLIDTIWQSTLAGAGAGMALTCGWYAILVSMITGIGVNKIANKVKISETQVMNLVQIIAKFLTKKVK